MYDILFSDNARKELLKLERGIQERIGAALERIRIRPEQFVEKLVGISGYKLRVGDYRLIIDILHEKLIVRVITIGHWRNVYK